MDIELASRPVVPPTDTLSQDFILLAIFLRTFFHLPPFSDGHNLSTITIRTVYTSSEAGQFIDTGCQTDRRKSPRKFKVIHQEINTSPTFHRDRAINKHPDDLTSNLTTCVHDLLNNESHRTSLLTPKRSQHVLLETDLEIQHYYMSTCRQYYLEMSGGIEPPQSTLIWSPADLLPPPEQSYLGHLPKSCV